MFGTVTQKKQQKNRNYSLETNIKQLFSHYHYNALNTATIIEIENHIINTRTWKMSEKKITKKLRRSNEVFFFAQNV